MHVMWDMHRRTTEEQARINRGRSDYGKNTSVEAASPSDDFWDGCIKLAGCGVVHAAAGADKPTGGTG